MKYNSEVPSLSKDIGWRPHFVSLQSLSVTGELVPLIKSHDPLVDNPLVPGNDWTAPMRRSIVLNDRLIMVNIS